MLKTYRTINFGDLSNPTNKKRMEEMSVTCEQWNSKSCEKIVECLDSVRRLE